VNPIICSNDAQTVLNSLREYLTEDKIIKDIHLLERNDTQIVFLVDDKPINKQAAEIWWSGYSEGLKVALETL